MGTAQTIQGEVLRVSGKIAREICDNGACNWDADFRKMLNALLRYFEMGSPLTSAELNEAAVQAKQIRNDDNAPERLEQLALQWVKLNPNPIPLEKTEYNKVSKYTDTLRINGYVEGRFKKGDTIKRYARPGESGEIVLTATRKEKAMRNNGHATIKEIVEYGLNKIPTDQTVTVNLHDFMYVYRVL